MLNMRLKEAALVHGRIDRSESVYPVTASGSKVHGRIDRSENGRRQPLLRQKVHGRIDRSENYLPAA